MSVFLVMGATGKTGRRVVKSLAAAGHTVRAAARHPGSPDEGVAPVRLDWFAPATHERALEGVSGVYIIPPEGHDDYVGDLAKFIECAHHTGVRRAVLLSARGADADPTSVAARAQQALLAAPLEGTVLQASGFAQNFTESFFVPDESGAIHAPAGNGKVPFIDIADIAAVAVAVLTGGGHHGRTYQLSGPSSLSFADAATILADVTGRDIHHVDVDPAQWRAGLLSHGIPVENVDYLDSIFSHVRAGFDDVISDGVDRVLGRAPTRFQDWARREAPTALSNR